MAVITRAALLAALEAARHELTTLHGLYAYDGAAPDETWQLDTRAVREQIDAVLIEPETPEPPEPTRRRMIRKISKVGQTL